MSTIELNGRFSSWVALRENGCVVPSHQLKMNAVVLGGHASD